MSETSHLLSGLTDRQVREFCIEAVRRVRRTGDKASTVRIDLADDWATQVLEFFAWLESSGLAFRYGGTVQEPVQRLRLLPAGLRFFDSNDPSHPLIPGWAERLRQRCPKLTGDTFDLVVDSHECFERGLLRAAIALLGVAFEGVVDDALNAMISAGLTLPKPTPNNASQRLASARAGAALKFPGPKNRDARANVEQACDFADRLRRRRNDASHRATAFAFQDRQEVEEFFIMAALELPALHTLL